MDTTKGDLKDGGVWTKKKHLEELHGPKNHLIFVNVKENCDMSQFLLCAREIN
jgi:hypothetical protein